MLAQANEVQKDLAHTRNGVLPAASTDPRGNLSTDQGDTQDVHYLSLSVPSHYMAKVSDPRLGEYSSCPTLTLSRDGVVHENLQKALFRHFI